MAVHSPRPMSYTQFSVPAYQKSIFPKTSKRRLVENHDWPHSYDMLTQNQSIASRIKPSDWTSLSHRNTLNYMN